MGPRDARQRIQRRAQPFIGSSSLGNPPGLPCTGVSTIVRRVWVERDETGGVVVDWTFAGTPATVDIAGGPTPDPDDHVHVTSVGADSSQFRFEGHEASPRYVSIRVRGGDEVVVAAPRRVTFEGLQNFRDLGGYRTSDGGHTVWGQIYRADALHKLTAADLIAFERLGVRVVYDLRGDKERATHPNPFEAIQLAVVGQQDDGEGRAVDPGVYRGTSDGERLLRDLYLGMLEHSGPLLGQLLTGLARSDHRPAVFHCHAGKDRTGIVAALILLVAGVSRDDILDDYELTRRYRTLDHQQDSFANLLEMGMSPEAAAGVLAAPRWAMEAAIDAIDVQYGGIDAYLSGPAGVARSSIAELRRALVTHASPRTDDPSHRRHGQRR